MRDFNQKRGDDDDNNNNNDNGFGQLPFDLSLCNPPPPLISEDDYDEIEKDLTPAQKVLIGDTAKALPFTAREKVAVAEKVFFPKADAFFENDNRKPFDDAEMI